MTLASFAASLRRHDASVATALLELVRRANDAGALDRGEWMAALRAAHARALADAHHDALPADATVGEIGDAGELERYLEEHVLRRLSGEDVAYGEPADDGWERVRLSPAALEEIRDGRAGIIVLLEQTVRNLLEDGERQLAETGRPEPLRLESASTLTARGLEKIYRRRRVVADVDLEVSQGEIVGLLGPNGAGKTTTFYMMVGLISPDAGRVFLDEEELTRMPMYRRARKGIGYLAQEPSIFRKLTVEENILAILETMKLSRAERNRRLDGLLDELGLKHLRQAKAYSLSGGERRRLEITRALVTQPKFMLLDEPFAGVDPIAVHDIQQIVADLRHRGIGVIITDHNVEQTLDIVDRAYIMYDGRVRVSGTVAELVWNDEVAEIYFGPTLTARMRQRYQRPEVAV
jgi:lipopolysaccharide export system ATP-binding protein